MSTTSIELLPDDNSWHPSVPPVLPGDEVEDIGLSAWDKLSEVIEWIYQPGEDGVARSSFKEAAFRFAVFTWFIQPSLFNAASQHDLGIMLREKVKCRCPECDATWATEAMHKQSVNRLVTQLRDKYHVQNSTMRPDSARKKFQKINRERNQTK